MTDSLSQYCPNCEAQAKTIEALREALQRIEAATRNEMRAGDKGYISRYGIHGIACAALQETGQ